MSAMRNRSLVTGSVFFDLRREEEDEDEDKCVPANVYADDDRRRE